MNETHSTFFETSFYSRNVNSFVSYNTYRIIFKTSSEGESEMQQEERYIKGRPIVTIFHNEQNLS